MPILFTSFVYGTNVHWSFIHGIKRKPHLAVVWNWYHFVAIAILHQLRPTDSADINTRLQLSDTSSIPPMHDGFLLEPMLKYCWYKPQWNSNKNTKLLIHENAVENGVCEMAAILSGGEMSWERHIFSLNDVCIHATNSDIVYIICQTISTHMILPLVYYV